MRGVWRGGDAEDMVNAEDAGSGEDVAGQELVEDAEAVVEGDGVDSGRSAVRGSEGDVAARVVGSNFWSKRLVMASAKRTVRRSRHWRRGWRTWRL